jgi:hypothetical protein
MDSPDRSIAKDAVSARRPREGQAPSLCSPVGIDLAHGPELMRSGQSSYWPHMTSQETNAKTRCEQARASTRAPVIFRYIVCFMSWTHCAPYIPNCVNTLATNWVAAFSLQGEPMKYVAKMLTVTAVAFAILAPALAEAHSHKECHYDHHHHRVCRWVK